MVFRSLHNVVKIHISVGLFSNGVVDENFLDLYGIQLLEGRNFHPDLPADQKSVLISRNAAERLRFFFTKECVGARIILPNNNIHDVEIIGVYDDYEFQPYFSKRRRSQARQHFNL